MDQNMAKWHETAPTHRRIVRRPTLLRAEFGTLRLSWPCLVIDISPRGAGVRFHERHALAIGAESTLRLRQFGLIRSEVRHCEQTSVGLLFSHRGMRDHEMARWLDSMHIV